MPLPKPQSGETEDDFISRCMSDETMLGEYEDESVRGGICYTQWENRDKQNERFVMKSTQCFPFDIKEVTEEGTFEGWLSVYNEVDLGRDKVLPGAFTKTLSENNGLVPLLWYHDHKQPIGTLELEDKKEGLWVTGKFVLDVKQAQEAYSLVKAEVIRGLSIGYKALKKEMKEGIRHLKEVKLFEGSLVLFPMLPTAQVTDVKSDKADDFETLFERYRIQSERTQMQWALLDSLDMIFWDWDLSNESKISASDESIQQFHTAYVELLPKIFELMDKSENIEIEPSRPLPEKTRASIKGAIAHLASMLEAAGTSLEAGDTPDGEAVTTTKEAVDTPSNEQVRSMLASIRDELRSKAG